MKKSLALMAIVLAVGLTAGMDAQARRLGGGKSAGMQRQAVTAPARTPPTPAAPAATPGAPQTAPAAAAAATAAPAAAAATKRSWMGPLAGLAAGLGLAALASHFGFGEALANMMTIALVVMAGLALVGFFMRRRMAGQGGLAAAGGAGGVAPRVEPSMQAEAYRSPLASGGSLIGSRVGGGAAAAAVDGAVGRIPEGFDTAAFERIARDQFTALQAANDAADFDRLRDCLTPEMLEVVRAEIAERAGAVQKTEVYGLNAQVLDVAEEADRYVVSVRFTGSVREQAFAPTQDLDEVWHLSKPRSGFGGWVIAGIQQAA